MDAAVALFVLVAVGVFYLFTGHPQQEGKASNVIATDKGARTNHMLPNGGNVWVKANSRLTYNHMFGTKTRSVYLSGETYFKVAEEKAHSFTATITPEINESV